MRHDEKACYISSREGFPHFDVSYPETQKCLAVNIQAKQGKQ